MMTKKAHEQAFDLMPSPTATVMPCLPGEAMSRTHLEHAVAQPFDFGAAPSPTVNTKQAEHAVFDLMPSPTATLAVPMARLEFRAHKATGDDALSADAPAASGGGFMIREDTSLKGFIRDTSRAASIDANDLSEAKHLDASGGGFMIREDTNLKGFIASDPPTADAAPAGGGGFQIREDTDVRGFEMDVPADGAPHVSAHCAPDVPSDGAPASVGGAPFEMREDTHLKGEAVGEAQQAGTGGFVIREDTNLKGFGMEEEVAAGPVGGEFMIREDTDLKGFQICQYTEQVDDAMQDPVSREEEVDLFASPSSGLHKSQPMQHTVDNDENAPPLSKQLGLHVLQDEAANTSTSGGAPAEKAGGDDDMVQPMTTEATDAHVEVATAGDVDIPQDLLPPAASATEEEVVREEGCVDRNGEKSSDGDVSRGLEEIATLYPDLNTIAEGSHDENSKFETSHSRTLNLSHAAQDCDKMLEDDSNVSAAPDSNVSAAPDTNVSAVPDTNVCVAATSNVQVFEDVPQVPADEEELDLMPSPTATVTVPGELELATSLVASISISHNSNLHNAPRDEEHVQLAQHERVQDAGEADGMEGREDEGMEAMGALLEGAGTPCCVHAETQEAVCTDTQVPAEQQEQQPVSRLSPLSQAVRNKVRRSTHKSLDCALATHEQDAAPENEAATTDDEAGGACHGAQREEEEALAGVVASLVDGGGEVEEDKVEALFWKSSRGPGGEGDKSVANGGNGTLNLSGELGRSSRRNRSSVCYTELPINTK